MKLILNPILHNFKRLFSKKKQKKLVIELGSDWLKWVVSIQKLGSYQVVDGGLILLSAEDVDLNKDLKNLLSKHDLSSNDIVISVPRHQVAARIIKIPSTNPSEIKKIVDLQAVKQTPYKEDEIIYDYTILESPEEGFSHVQLVIAHQHILNRYLRVLRNVGVKPAHIAFSIEGCASWLQKEVGSIKGFSMKDDVAIVLDVDVEHMFFQIWNNGVSVSSQTISLGSKKLSGNPENFRDKLVADISRCLQIYNVTKGAKTPTKVILTGSYSCLKPFHDWIGQNINLPIEELPMNRDVQGFMEGSKGAESLARDASFASIVGLVTRKSALKINLLPQEIIMEAALMQKGKDLLIFGALVLSAALVVSAIFGAKYYQKRQYLNWLETKIRLTQPQAEMVHDQRTYIKDIIELEKSSTYLFDEILHVHSVLPKEIFLTELTMSSQGSYHIRGQADQMTYIFDFVSSLEEHELFSNVETKRLTKRILENKEVVDFEINSTIRSR